MVVCASKGGAYMLELWRRSYTTPSVMINVHPACCELPKNVPIVLVHGANDTTFKRDRGISNGDGATATTTTTTSHKQKT